MPSARKRYWPSTLILFQSRDPLPVPVLTRTLNAINRDFNRAFRRDLAIAVSGRALGAIELEDAGARTGQLDDLSEFTRNLRQFFEPVILDSQNAGASSEHATIDVSDTAKALAKAVMRTGTSIRIRSTAPSGGMINIHVSGPFAHKMLRKRQLGIGTAVSSPNLTYLEERISAVFNEFAHVRTEQSAAPCIAFDPHGPMALVLGVFIERIVSHRGGAGSISRFARRVHELGHIEAALWIEQTARELVKQHR
jgi:hypothetical protein